MLPTSKRSPVRTTLRRLDRSGPNGPIDRSADWLHQDCACFACHQGVEKALKALHLQHGQQTWGHGPGCSFRLRILHALCIPSRPAACPFDR